MAPATIAARAAFVDAMKLTAGVEGATAIVMAVLAIIALRR